MPTPDELRRLAGDAQHVAKLEQAKVRAAEARTPREWMELFQEITESSVKTIQENEGLGHKVLEVLEPWRPSYRRVSEALQSHGMPLTEEIEVEGPIMGTTRSGLPVVDGWHGGHPNVTFHWPDKSKLHFRGRDALVAVSFWMWWVHFQEVHNQQLGIAKNAEMRTRLILPGSPDSVSYHAAKKDDRHP